MGAQRQLEERAVVEDREAEEEERGRDDRVGQDPQIARVDDGEDELARTEGLVLARGEGPQREGHRRARHHEERGDHRDAHVLDHVPGKAHLAVDAGAARGEVEEDEPAEHPADGSQGRPVVAPRPQPEHPAQVHEDRDDGDGQPQPVDLPLGEPAHGAGRPRVEVAGQVVDDRGLGALLRRGRRRGAADGGAQTHRPGHDRHLAQGQPGEGGGAPLLARVEGSDDPVPVPPAGSAEEDRGDRLEDEQDPVARVEAGEAADVDPRGEQPGPDEQDEAPARDRGVAPHRHPEVLAERRADDDERDEPADPHAGGDEVEAESVDPGHVIEARRGVAGEGQRQQGEEAGPGEPRESGLGGGERCRDRDDGDDERGDDRGPGGVQLPDEGHELGEVVRVGEPEAGERGEVREDPAHPGEEPDDGGPTRELGEGLPARGARRLRDDEGREREGPDRHRRRRVVDGPEGRQRPPDEGPRVAEVQGRCAPAEGRGGEDDHHRDETEESQRQGGRAGGGLGGGHDV